MYKLNITIIMILSLYLQSALSQVPYDQKLLNKYCAQKGTKEVRAEVVTENGRKKIVCHDGVLNQLAFYEKTNMVLNRSSDEKFDTLLYSSAEWENYLKNIIVNRFAKYNSTEAEKCQFITVSGIHTIQCENGSKAEVTEIYKVKKDQFEKAYQIGSEKYASNSDGLTLKDIYSLNATPTKETSVISNNGSHFPSNFWDEIAPFGGTEVKLDKKITTPWTLEYNNVFGQTIEKSKPPTTTLYSIKVENLLTPIVHDKNFKVIPLDHSKEIVAEEVTPTVKEDKETDCNEKLTLEIAKLLEDDEKNIIGLQFELTVIKMAAQVVGSQRVSLEGLAKKYEKDLAKVDSGILEKMKELYKKHGLKEDEQKVLTHLKKKTASANYYDKDKRFFNQESSAFLMAYQQMNPESGIKDSDVSVLWFMDKVSEKSKTQNGQYSSLHNRTNLSTRISQYTGAIDASKAISKTSLDEMVKKQKIKIDAEFLALIENFKQTNLPCYNEIFGEGENDCNLDQIEARFSELLAVNSKISSSDLVSIDDKLKGGIDKTRFSISKYVESPTNKTVKVVIPQPVVQVETRQVKVVPPDDDNDMKPQD